MNKQRVAYTPTGGVCSKMMIVDAEDNVITGVQIVGGCHGNTQGISQLLVGMEVEEAIRRLEGIDCRERGTSCPDQLAQALKRCHRERAFEGISQNPVKREEKINPGTTDYGKTE